jgi:hypothetical protein
MIWKIKIRIFYERKITLLKNTYKVKNVGFFTEIF